MSALLDAAERLRRRDTFPILSHERLFATERAAAALEGRRRATGDRSADIRRLRDGLAAMRSVSSALIADALAADRRSLDRALVAAYLALLPCNHSGFEILRAAAETAAERHDWRWRDLGRRYGLWSPVRDAAGRWHLTEPALHALAAA